MTEKKIFFFLKYMNKYLIDTKEHDLDVKFLFQVLFFCHFLVVWDFFLEKNKFEKF